jgi:hypothetical protein
MVGFQTGLKILVVLLEVVVPVVVLLLVLVVGLKLVLLCPLALDWNTTAE